MCNTTSDNTQLADYTDRNKSGRERAKIWIIGKEEEKKLTDLALNEASII